MATVLVVTSAPPLVEGGHLVIARALVRALADGGHQAGLVTTPSNRFGHQASAYVANWMTDVSQTGLGQNVDQVISLRFPSYAVRHPRHVCWLNHTMREYYDLWDTFSASLSPQGKFKESLRRRAMHAADTYLFKHNVTKLCAQSTTVQARLAHFNGVASTVLHPPPPQRPYRCDGYGDYLFVPSRLTPLKRVDLVIRALAEPQARHVRVVIGGEGEMGRELDTLARALGVDARVTFAGRLTEEALVSHYAQARGVVFVPRDEDYGFVTVEALASGKAVITARDSGGPLEFIRQDETGHVVDPKPAAVATAMAALMDSAAEAERLGSRGRAETVALTWPATVASLLLS